MSKKKDYKKTKKFFENKNNKMMVLVTTLIILCFVLISIIVYKVGYDTANEENELKITNQAYAEYAQTHTFLDTLDKAGTIVTLKLLDNLVLAFIMFCILVWGLSNFRLIGGRG